MHDIWNPWHGCIKKSEGCRNCYMYFLDRQRGGDGGRIYKVRNNFDYPLQKDRDERYKVKSGEQIRVCMTSDFFGRSRRLASGSLADNKAASGRRLFLLTKRPERVRACLPPDWNDGWENVFSTLPAKIRKWRTNVFLCCWNFRLSIRELWPPRSSAK